MDGTDVTMLLALVAAAATLVHALRTTRTADIAPWRKVFTIVVAPIGAALVVLAIGVNLSA